MSYVFFNCGVPHEITFFRKNSNEVQSGDKTTDFEAMRDYFEELHDVLMNSNDE